MNIFITGGSRGIGSSLAQLYRSKGHNVGICGTRELNDELYYQADISDQSSIESVVTQFESEFGTIDLFIANAGIGINKKTQYPDFQRDLNLTRVNVQGFLNSANSIIPRFIQREAGHFVAISSLSALIGLPRNGAYCASKAFVSRYTQSLSRDLKKLGINITCIHPSYVDTDHTKENNHSMPFLISSDEAALKISKAIKNKKESYSFVFPTNFLAYFISIIPQAVQTKILNLIKFK